jgi:hypothetical protein
MCEVCAAFGRGQHWTDLVDKTGAHPEAVDIRNHRAVRRRVVHVVNMMLTTHALHAEDWDGEAFLLTRPSGASQRATDLSNLWAQAQSMLGVPVDPLSDT